MLSIIGIVFVGLFIVGILFAVFGYDIIYNWTKKETSIYLTVMTWCAVIGYLGIILGYYFRILFYFGKISDGNELWAAQS